MCQAIPRKVLQVAEGRAEVLYDGEPVWVAVHGILSLQPGEYLIVYAGQALERMPAGEAEEMLRSIREMELFFEEVVGQ